MSGRVRFTLEVEPLGEPSGLGCSQNPSSASDSQAQSLDDSESDLVCESLCCQDTLDLYQAKDPVLIRKTRILYGQRF